jgi:hypothetical protein
MIRRYLPRDTEQLIHWYTRYFSPLGLIAGFLADTFFFLSRVDQASGLAILFFHLTLAALAILFLSAIQEGSMRSAWALKAAPFAPVIMQFAFGGLFSAFFSLYSRSAAFPATWLFVALLAILLVGNERFLKFYSWHTFQVSIYFVSLLSFTAFFLPVALHRIGNDIFVLGSFMSLGIMIALLAVLYRVAPSVALLYRTQVARALAVILGVFVGLYFTNLIPPLPLALKTSAILHDISREADGSYRALREPVSLKEQIIGFRSTFHKVSGESVYVFTAIFAPTGLSTSIIHEWQWFDAQQGAWTTVAEVPFDIIGGRDGGYRGWSGKHDPAPGNWRVNVLTPSGKLITRVSFVVEEVVTSPEVIGQTL